MKKLLKQKFQQGTYYAELLKNTYPRKIIEGNTWGDIYWGVCDGIGENNLGKLLMEIRQNLINQDSLPLAA